MRTLEFGAADIARLRYAISPIHELVWSTVALRKPERWLHRDWRDRVLKDLDGDFALLRALTGGSSYAPDFLTPVPDTSRPSLDEELATVAATPPKVAADEVHMIHAGGRPPDVLRDFTADPDAGMRRLVAQLSGYFERFLAQHWARLRSIGEADIAHRSALAASAGPVSMIAELHPRIAWDGTHLTIGGRRSPSSGFGDDLVLIPTCFAWPGVYVTAEPRPDTAIAYSPRGVGQLWSRQRPSGTRAAVALLGETRAAILMLIHQGRSTGEVADALDLAPSTASHHLTVLRDAGLATTHRRGRVVRYLRTELGDRLVGRWSRPGTVVPRG